MRCTKQRINKLVAQIREGHAPAVSKTRGESLFLDPALPGFYIRVLYTGKATWVVQWKRLGRQKKIKLGDVKVLDRDMAIKAARELLAKITLDMLDPHAARRERMRAAKVTLKTVVPLFLDHKIRRGLRPNTAELWERLLTGYYLQPLHGLPIDEITRDQIQTQIDAIAIQSSATASHCYTSLSVLFKWAIKTGKLPEGHRNPMDGVQAPPEGKPRERVLNDDEIRIIWKTCEAWEEQAIHDRQVRASGGTVSRMGRSTVPD